MFKRVVKTFLNQTKICGTLLIFHGLILALEIIILKEKSEVENIDSRIFEVKTIAPENSKQASFTHYLHNYKNGVSKFYKETALDYVKEILIKENSERKITNKIAEETLKHLIDHYQKSAPFPAPKKSTFKFIDLFAGIGGFRIAMQNVGGRKCVYTSEWNKDAQKTYSENCGEIPFGDITKESVKNYIPEKFDILCAGFPCQAFSIAGYRKGFTDTRGTLFLMLNRLLKNINPRKC